MSEPMKTVPTFYIATGLDNVAQHHAVRDALMAAGFSLTYDWTVHGSVQHLGRATITQTAEREVKGVKDADIVIVLLPGASGTHVELGVALALGKPVFLHSPVPVLERPRVCCFHLHPFVYEFQDIDALLKEALAERPLILTRRLRAAMDDIVGLIMRVGAIEGEAMREKNPLWMLARTVGRRLGEARGLAEEALDTHIDQKDKARKED